MNKQSKNLAAGAGADIQWRLQGERYRALQDRRKAGNRKDIRSKYKAVTEACRGLTDDAKTKAIFMSRSRTQGREIFSYGIYNNMYYYNNLNN